MGNAPHFSEFRAIGRHRSGPSASPWELAAEAIAVKIRWFGLLLGYAAVNLADHDATRQAVLNAILCLGSAYTLLDTWFSLRGRVFLRRHPLFVGLMEATFIALLCFYDGGLESNFRHYYFLSLVCCAIRHSPRVTYATCALHCLSYGLLFAALAPELRRIAPFTLTVVTLAWVTWASSSLALLLKRVGEYLSQLNAALRQNQSELERRIAERTQELQESQAHVLHQEKMAAFGLLAAGIAHEVGNPLTSISSMVQILQRREADPYTLNKLGLVSGQLQRIRTTLRELIEFSRPASPERCRVALGDVLDEALNIAKYYKRTRGRIASPALPADLPVLYGLRDQLVQVFLNLILNAIDATSPGVRGQTAEGPSSLTSAVELGVSARPGGVEVTVRDDGCGVPAQHAEKLFQPYFTTKKHGTGLGLFVTRQLVTEHGGSVTFESRPGEGATFRVFLPAAAPEVRFPRRSEPEAVPAASGDRSPRRGEGVSW